MAELPHIGLHCGSQFCNRLDFLPVRCDACKENFCVDHFTYEAHSCKNAYSKNVQVPVCPLCNVPVPTPKGKSPDQEVDEHIQNNCALSPKKKIFTNRCNSKGCKKKELIPMVCATCKMNFCISHRHERDHNCIGPQRGISKAALAAMNRNQGSCSSQALKNTMASDEQLARALAASMANTTLSDEDRDRQLALELQQQEYEGRQQQQQSSKQSNCSLS